jgi:hypothetical protein
VAFIFLNFIVIMLRALSISQSLMPLALASYKITRLAVLIPMACLDFGSWIGEGDREEREKKRNL